MCVVLGDRCVVLDVDVYGFVMLCVKFWYRMWFADGLPTMAMKGVRTSLGISPLGRRFQSSQVERVFQIYF